MRNWIFLGLMGVIGTFAFAQDPYEKSSLAYESYLRGEEAETVAERNAAFNEALSLYSEVADEISSGKIYFNIGNCYFQLQNYPWAILYYYRAEKLLPREEKVKQNLALALEKIGVEPQVRGSVFHNVFFVHYKLSLAERMQAFSVFAVASFFSLLTYLWIKKRWLRLLSQVLASITALLILSLIISHYFGGLYGVVVKATPLYRDAGYHYAPVAEDPLFAGTRAQVLQVTSKGQWLKVSTSDSTMGYVPYQAIRLI